jgi:hypothetical protein
MKLVKCKVLEMSVRHGEFGQRIGQGKVVDLDRVVSKDAEGKPITLGDLVRGREDCFESADGDGPSAGPQLPPAPLDVDEE